MIKYFKRIQNQDGVTLPGALLTIIDTQTDSEALIYDDDGAPLSNPVTADAYGMVQFNIKTGLYDLTFRLNAFTVTIEDVEISEEENLIYLVNDQGTSLTYGTLCYSSSTGKCKKAKNNGTLEEASALYICLETTLTNGSTGKFALTAVITTPGTPGDNGYLSSAGGVLAVEPYASDANFLTVIGKWISTTEFLVIFQDPIGLAYDSPAPPDIHGELWFNFRNRSGLLPLVGM